MLHEPSANPLPQHDVRAPSVRLHFLHIGKTGGTAVKRALRSAGYAYFQPQRIERATPTPFGKIELHHHSYRLADVPEGDFIFFCLRDPIARFVSGFESRRAKGQPRYYREWSDGERAAFERFPTPSSLANALYAADDQQRKAARRAMRKVQHLLAAERILGSPRQVWKRRGRIVYIARQETLGEDWVQLRRLLGIPETVELPSGKAAHQRGTSPKEALDPAAIAALRRWYEPEYRLLAYCERLRAWNGWGTAAAADGGPVRRGARRLRSASALLPPAPDRSARRARS